MLGVVHKETATGLTSLTHTRTCEVFVRESRLATLNLSAEFFVDGLRGREIIMCCSSDHIELFIDVLRGRKIIVSFVVIVFVYSLLFIDVN